MMADIAPDRSTVAILALGSSLDSAIDFAGDRDLVRVQLDAGGIYAFDLLGAASGMTLADPVLTLLDANLAPVAADDDSGLGLNARLALSAPSSGNYYIEAASFGGQGTYRLAMNLALDDYGQTFSHSGHLIAGGSAVGSADFIGDCDWFRVDLAAGTTYSFFLSGAPSENGMMRDPALTLFDGAGATLVKSDDSADGSLDSQFSFSPSQSGTYYLEATATDGGIGSYRLSAEFGAAGNESARGDVTIHNGTAGNDSFFEQPGDDLISGGGGVDTMHYAGLMRSYGRALDSGSGSIAGGLEGGIDTLDGVDTFVFADGYLTSDPDSQAAQIFRLYNLVLQRDPDSKGLIDWTHTLEHGMSLPAVADAFFNSAEFQAKTVGLSTADFVEFLYNEGLGRESDPAGKASWVGAIDIGSLTRGQVILNFSESPEYHGLTDHKIEEGLFIYDETYAAISSLYDAFADRLPDEAGLCNWVAAADSGMAMEEIADRFAGSAEYQQKIAGLSERGIVEQLYRNVLDREGEPSGIDAWTAKLESDHDVGSMLLAFSNSLEHQALMQPFMADGIMYL